MTLFISEKRKKSLLKNIIIYIGITLFIAIFGIVYEQYSHNVYSFHMWFAWIWVLCFGVIPYLLLYFLPVTKVPGSVSETTYNLGVAMLTTRSIFIGVIDIYGTTNRTMVIIYTVISIVFLVSGFLMYITAMLIDKFKAKE